MVVYWSEFRHSFLRLLHNEPMTWYSATPSSVLTVLVAYLDCSVLVLTSSHPQYFSFQPKMNLNPEPLVCLCGHTFPQSGALACHKWSCKGLKRKLEGTLESVKKLWKKMKSSHHIAMPSLIRHQPCQTARMSSRLRKPLYLRVSILRYFEPCMHKSCCPELLIPVLSRWSR